MRISLATGALLLAVVYAALDGTQKAALALIGSTSGTAVDNTNLDAAIQVVLLLRTTEDILEAGTYFDKATIDAIMANGALNPAPEKELAKIVKYIPADKLAAVKQADLVRILKEVVVTNPGDILPSQLKEKAIFDEIVQLVPDKKDLFKRLTIDQFKAVMSKKGLFGNDTTAAALTELVAAHRPYLKEVTPEFLDHLITSGGAALPKTVIPFLPDNYLTEITKKPSKKDGKHWTQKQIEACAAAPRKTALDFTEAKVRFQASVELVERADIFRKAVTTPGAGNLKAAITACGSDVIWAEFDKFLTASVVKALAAKDDNTRLVLSTIVGRLSKAQLATVKPAHLAKVYNAKVDKTDTYANIDVKFFDKATLENGIMINNAKEKEDEFLEKITDEQFEAILALPAYPKQLTGKMLNFVADKVSGTKAIAAFEKRAKSTPISLLDHVFDSARVVPLSKRLIQALPENFLNEITNAPHPEDAKHWTDEQISRIDDDCKAKLDLSLMPRSRQALLHGKTLRKMKEIHYAVLNTDQWNEILESVKYGTQVLNKMPQVGKIRFDDLDGIVFTPKSFSKLTAELQVYLLKHHSKLPEDILSMMTLTQLNAWSSSMDVLRSLPEKAMLQHLGAHEDVGESEHPLSNWNARRFQEKDYAFMLPYLTPKAIEAMGLSVPETLDAFLVSPEVYACLPGTYTALAAIELKDRATTLSVWQSPKFTPAIIARAFGQPGSLLAAEFQRPAFNQLTEEQLAAIPSAALLQMPFVAELGQKEYEKLSATAFASATANDASKIKLASITADQLENLSMDAPTNVLSTAVPAQVAAGVVGREARLSAKQVASMPKETVAAVMTPEAIPRIRPEACRLMTASQLTNLPSSAVAALTPEQVGVMGADVSDARLSALEFLLGNRKSLSPASATALETRAPGSAANAIMTSSALAALAAAVMLFL